MPPSNRVPGPASSTAEAWEAWWRDHVTDELERLNNNEIAIRSEFEAACRAIRAEIQAELTKVRTSIATVDKTSSVDIRDLQVRAAIGGFLGGTAATIIVGIILFLVEQRLRSG